MQRALSAPAAIFFKLQFFFDCFLISGGIVIYPMALGAF